MKKTILLFITAFLLTFTIKAQHYLNNVYDAYNINISINNSIMHNHIHMNDYNYFNDWKTKPYCEKILILEDSTEVILEIQIQFNVIPQVCYRNYCYNPYNHYRHWDHNYWYGYNNKRYPIHRSTKVNNNKRYPTYRNMVSDKKYVAHRNNKVIDKKLIRSRATAQHLNSQSLSKYMQTRRGDRSPYSRVLNNGNGRNSTVRQQQQQPSRTQNNWSTVQKQQKQQKQKTQNGSMQRSSSTTQSRSKSTSSRIKRNKPLEHWMFEPLNL